MQIPLKQLIKLISTPTWGSTSTWVTLRSKFSLITCCNTPLSQPVVLKLPPHEATWTSQVFLTRGLACRTRCSINGLPSRLSHCSPASIDLKGKQKARNTSSRPLCSYSSMISLIWKVASRPLSGLFFWLPSMACFGIPTFYPCRQLHLTRVSNSLRLILKSSPEGFSLLFTGVRPFSFVSAL